MTRKSMVLTICALVLAAFAALIGGLFAPAEAAEQGLTVAGTVLLLAAHWQRLRKAHPH